MIIEIPLFFWELSAIAGHQNQKQDPVCQRTGKI